MTNTETKKIIVSEAAITKMEQNEDHIKADMTIRIPTSGEGYEILTQIMDLMEAFHVKADIVEHESGTIFVTQYKEAEF